LRLYYEKIETCDKVYSIEAFVYIVGIVIAAAIIAVTVKICRIYHDKIKFFLTGFDSKFTFSEIRLLWKTAKVCNIEQPLSLYWSLPALTGCIAQIKSGTDRNTKMNFPYSQRLLTKLYTYRTKIEQEADRKKGIESTMSLERDQRLRIILPGKGVFFSRIVNNARELTISVPTQKEIIPVEGKDWIGKTINVYLWRKGDARYVFDTTVLGEGLFLGKPSLYLRHTDKLLRTQKRNSVRAKCRIYASLFIIKERVIDYNTVETRPGYRCLIEDISESGAMVRIGGKGVPNIQMKLQFTLEDKLVIMFGIVRTIEYNKTINQSRLHFECIHIEPQMKNEVLSFVYNIMPPAEKEIYDAISMTTEDQNESGDDEDDKKIEKSEPADGTQQNAVSQAAENEKDDFLPNLPMETQLFSEDAAGDTVKTAGKSVVDAGEPVSSDTLNEV
jgi:c-di-GMP-binding flagellar brake protein YcgR